MQAIEFKEHLTQNLIPFWNRLKDTEYGGFYSYMSKDLEIDKTSEKGVILNNRILWFYSTAYRLLRDPSLLAMADHAFSFLINHCYDSQYGGVYWSVSHDGKPIDETKHTYNQAFAIYALSAYYEVSQNKAALHIAYALYRLIESKCRDTDGYLEAFHLDFTPTSNEKLSENGVMAERTMNTLLHVMEAYTELYRVDSFAMIGNSLREILDLFKDKIYNSQKQICEVFFDKDYHSLIDLESFGHDIETAWLLDRGCEVLADPTYSEAFAPITAGLAAATYHNAYDQTKHALYNERENDNIDTDKIWWVQAESVVGFYNAYQKAPDKKEYLQAACDIWDYIISHMIDERCGEWVESIRPDDTINLERGIVHAWKCPYHNGRMCMEMMQRLTNKA